MSSRRVAQEDQGFLYVFPTDEQIHPGAYVMLRAGYGESRWGRTREGALVYITYLERRSFDLAIGDEKLHISAIQHTYEVRNFKATLSDPPAMFTQEETASVSS